MKKEICEFLGTMCLVLFGCGVAVLTDADVITTSLAFGLTIVALAYTIGNISGCHVNPAVSFACFIDKRLSGKDFIRYVIAQILGALAGTAILYAILSNTSLGTIALGANGFGDYSATHLTLVGALITEIVLTCIFVYTILGVTSDEKYSRVAGIVIGLTLTFVHLLGINLTGTSVNPARSLAPAIFLMGDAIKQVWVFIVGPLIGGTLAACIYSYLNVSKRRR